MIWRLTVSTTPEKLIPAKASGVPRSAGASAGHEPTQGQIQKSRTTHRHIHVRMQGHNIYIYMFIYISVHAICTYRCNYGDLSVSPDGFRGGLGEPVRELSEAFRGFLYRETESPLAKKQIYHMALLDTLHILTMTLPLPLLLSLPLYPYLHPFSTPIPLPATPIHIDLSLPLS